jgi:hypothetical protein
LADFGLLSKADQLIMVGVGGSLFWEKVEADNVIIF